MNIDNIDEEFDHVMLSRAENHFKRGFVTSLKDDSGGKYPLL